MNKTLLLFGMLTAVLSANAQLYTTVDKDGYTNIREKPTVNSAIIDKVLKNEIIFSADYFCGDEFDYSTLPPSWTAVKKYEGAPVGFIYTKNLRSIEDMPVLFQNEKSWNSDSITCENDTLTVLLILKPFDISSHKVEYEVTQDHKYIRSIDGEYPKGLRQVYGADESEDKEIEKLIIKINGKEYSLPINDIRSYYTPQMAVFIGSDGDLYINIDSGDGGEHFSIMLSVTDGKIVYSTPTEFC